MERRLTTILASDVVGYSRLMAADEAGTLVSLKAVRRELIEPKTTEYRGRVVKLMGDGTLMEFASVVDAVNFAADVQRAMAKRNAGVPEDRRITYRIGINIGDVIVEGDDIYGDGVNLAARLEALAQAGGVCISRSVHTQIKGKVDLEFEDLGERQVKNLPDPVSVYRLRPTTGDAESADRTAPAAPDRPSIAVLPFTNMSGDSEQEYFSDGITEDIITALTHWRSFPVIARNSTFTYKNKAVDIKQAGRELGARYLLEGSVRKSGHRVRITAQLIDGVRGHHIWAEKYDRELDDIFEVQDEIAQAITAIVAPELAKAEFKRAATKRPEDLDAWDYFLRGMAMIHESTCAGNAKARELFESALAIQADYGDAHAGIASSYNRDIYFQCDEDRMATATLAMQAARKAVKCDQASSFAHQELGTAYQWLNRPDDALAEATTAVNLNPNDADALHQLGNKSDLAGDPGGISHMEKAQKLNPLDTQSHSRLTFLARAYLNAGSYQDAVDRARRAIQRRPDYPHAYYILAIALGQSGRKDEARAALSKCDELHPGFIDSRRDWQPYVDPTSNQRLRDGLLEIGTKNFRE
jgi:adenylate cyclase